MEHKKAEGFWHGVGTAFTWAAVIYLLACGLGWLFDRMPRLLLAIIFAPLWAIVVAGVGGLISCELLGDALPNGGYSWQCSSTAIWLYSGTGLVVSTIVTAAMWDSANGTVRKPRRKGKPGSAYPLLM